MTKTNPTTIDEDEVGVVGLNDLSIESSLSYGAPGCDVEETPGQHRGVFGKEGPPADFDGPVETLTNEQE